MSFVLNFLDLKGLCPPWFVTWSIIYEFLNVSTRQSIHPRPLSFSDSWSLIQTLRMSPSFEILPETERHPEVLDELVREYPHISGTKFHDLHIAAVMREHVITEIRTVDTDFHQFKFLRVTNRIKRTEEVQNASLACKTGLTSSLRSFTAYSAKPQPPLCRDKVQDSLMVLTKRSA